jgi:ferredoxin
MSDQHLHVDMIACDAFGYCAELLPEIVELDEWGYPVVTGAVTPELLADARAAVDACPRLALRLAASAPRRPPRPLPVLGTPGARRR